jgi:hypothetical protein
MVALIICSGCTTLKLPSLTTNNPEYQNPEAIAQLGTSNSEQVYHGVRQAKAQNAIILQVVGAKTPIRMLPLPTDGRSVFLSDLMKQAGVANQLGAMQAKLFRSSADSIGGLPMDVKMGMDGKSVKPETDYALRPGDRIQVQKALSPAMRGLVNTLLGV